MNTQGFSVPVFSQTTVAKRAVLLGFGFWTGIDTTVEFLPAPPGSGIYFVRTDLPSAPPIAAVVANRVDKPRQTSLAVEGAQVDMVEHLLAAARGMGISNLEIRVSSAEIPGFDGSARPFALALKEAGKQDQQVPRPARVVGNTYRFGDDQRWIEISPPQGMDSVYRYDIDYTAAAGGRGGIGSQFFESTLTEETFLDEIAPARTFLLESEAQQLRAAGLCQRVQYGDVLVFGQDGPIENHLLWENECARHKVLDMIGDFSLADTPILGTFRAWRTGHSQNAAALRELLKILDQQ